MMSHYRKSHAANNRPSLLGASLNVQINETELQVSKRRSAVDRSASAGLRIINRQITSPASLLLAGGIGFIIGELTHRRSSKFGEMAQKPHTAEMTPLRTVLKFIALLRTVYAVLPLALIRNAPIGRRKVNHPTHKGVHAHVKNIE